MSGAGIRREERRISGTGSRTNVYHLEGLIAEATPYAQEKLGKREEAAKERTAAAKRRGRPRLRVVPKSE